MPDLDAIRARAEEAFLVGSHGTASGVWFADVTEEDVRRDARDTLTLVAELERLRKALRRIADEGHANPPAEVAAVARAALAAQESAE